MKNRENLYFFIFIILFLSSFLFWYFKIRTPVESSQLMIGESLESQRFLATVTKLRKIDLDAEFFKNEKFMSLKDLTPVIDVPKAIGKINPFAPL